MGSYWVGIPATDDNMGPYEDLSEAKREAREYSSSHGLVEVYEEGNPIPVCFYKDGRLYYDATIAWMRT